jgi:hypothetical protein
MKTRILVPLGAVSLAVAAISPASAQLELLHEWQFNEINGTGLASTQNSVSGMPTFNSDISSSSVQDGVFRIQRIATATPTTGFVDLTLGGTFTMPDYVVMDVTVAGWDLRGTGNQDVRFGFLNNAIGGSIEQTLELQVRRTATAEVSYAVIAQTTAQGASGAGTLVSRWSNVQTGPVHFRLIYDATDTTASNPTFALLIDDGGGFEQVLTGTTSDVRSLNTFRLGVINGSPGFDGGYFDVDSIAISAIPEPSTYALLAGLFLLAVAVVARRSRR